MSGSRGAGNRASRICRAGPGPRGHRDMVARSLSLLGALANAALAACLLAAPPAAAQSREPADAIQRLRCMACHAGPNRHAFDGKTELKRGTTINLEDFRNADHGKTHCLDCHSKGFDIFPHRAKKTETCMDCHPRQEKGAEADKPYKFERIRKEFEGTVHFTEYMHAKEACCGTATGKPATPVPASPGGDGAKKANQRFTCEHCHEPHYFKATSRIKEPLLIRANDNGPCLHCHMDGASVTLADPVKPSLLEAHSYLPHAKLHLDSSRCVDCHTNVMSKVAHDLPLGKKADQGCNTCHSVDSVLVTRLYRYVDNSEMLGFHNSRMLEDFYVMGGNRHRWTDVAAYLLMSFGLILVLVHGGWRMLARLRGAFAQGGHVSRS